MKFAKIAATLLTTASCLAPLTPAFAGPLDKYGGSILDPGSSVLSTDPRLLCNDVVKDATAEHRSSSGRDGMSQSAENDAWKKTDNDASTSSEKSSRGASFMGIGANMSDEKSSSHNHANSDEGKRDRSNSNRNSSRDEEYSKTSTPTAAGKDCSDFVKAAATRDAAAYQADAQVQSVKIATDGKLEAIKTEANNKFIEGLLKW
jgi:hypothetical protein